MRLPTLLAFDTATDVCAVALAHGDKVIERSETVGQSHSSRVLPMAQQLLADAGVALSELDAVAFGAGPGSFTGLRIACGVAQGLAYGIDRPVVPVGNLAALAFNAAQEQPAARRIVAAIDARMNEVYWALYETTGEPDRPLVERIAPSLSAAAALPAQLHSALDGEAADTLAGEAFAVFAGALDAIPAARRLPQARASAGAILRLAQRAFARGEAVAPAQAAPLYVRDRVAQTIDERQAARSAADLATGAAR
mgnify:CR=1 FL=1